MTVDIDVIVITVNYGSDNGYSTTVMLLVMAAAMYLHTMLLL